MSFTWPRQTAISPILLLQQNDIVTKQYDKIIFSPFHFLIVLQCSAVAVQARLFIGYFIGQYKVQPMHYISSLEANMSIGSFSWPVQTVMLSILHLWQCAVQDRRCRSGKALNWNLHFAKTKCNLCIIIQFNQGSQWDSSLD